MEIYGSSMFVTYDDALMRQWFIGNASVANTSDTACFVHPARESTTSLAFTWDDSLKSATTTTSSELPATLASENSLWILVGVATASVLACISMIFVIFIYRRRRSPFNLVKNSESQFSMTATALPTDATTIKSMSNFSNNEDSTLVGTIHELSVPAFLELKPVIDINIGGCVAEGGQSKLYECFPVSSTCFSRTKGDMVILKVMAPDVEDMREIMKQSFFQELSIMYRFRDHPLFSRVYGFLTKPAAILIKRYPLGDLQKFVMNMGPAAETYSYSKLVVVTLARRMASSVAYMHSSGLAHADIKASNFLLEFNPEAGLVPILTDFGISAVISDSISKVEAFETIHIPGASLAYAAPELLRSLNDRTVFYARDLTKCDAYSLGATLYCMLVRVPPWFY